MSDYIKKNMKITSKKTMWIFFKFMKKSKKHVYEYFTIFYLLNVEDINISAWMFLLLLILTLNLFELKIITEF